MWGERGEGDEKVGPESGRDYCCALPGVGEGHDLGDDGVGLKVAKHLGDGLQVRVEFA